MKGAVTNEVKGLFLKWRVRFRAFTGVWKAQGSCCLPALEIIGGCVRYSEYCAQCKNRYGAARYGSIGVAADSTQKRCEAAHNATN